MLATTTLPYKIPATLEELTPQTLEAAFARLHPGVTVTGCDLLEARRRGEFMVSTASRARMTLTYGPGSPPLPQQVLVKLAIPEDGASAPVLYETEVNIYNRMLPELDIVKPVVLAADYDADTGLFLLVMEDLSLKDAFFPNGLRPPLKAGQVRALLDQIAIIHATYWNSPRLEEESEWLSNLQDGRQFDFFEMATVPAITSYCADIPYRADMVTRLGRPVAALWENVKAVHRHHEAIFPPTLQHGDTGSHNSYHLPDGTAGWLDWQLAVRSAWPRDVHYSIVTALSIADRRVHERDLVAYYLRRLGELGVPDVPDIDLAMREYGRAIIWGFFIGWFMVPPPNYPPELIQTNLERLYQAMMDHDTLRLCDEVM